MDQRQTPILKVFEGVQALRAIAAIFVLLLHLTAIEQKYGPGVSMLPSVFRFGSIGVDIFFVISGFIMTVIIKNQFGKSYGYTFLFKRAARIYPIYWLYSLLVLGIFLVRPDMVNSSQGNQVNLIKSFLLLPDKNLPLLMVGWSLIYEVYFYLVIALALRFVKETRYPLFLASWGIFLVTGSWLLSWTTENPWLTVIASPLCLEFIAGAFIALSFHRIHIKYGPIFLGLGMFIIFWASFYMTANGGGYIQAGWMNTGIFGTGACFLVLGAVVYEAKLTSIIPKWLAGLGDASYSLYLSHLLVISALGRIWLTLPFAHGSVGHIISLSVIFLSALLWAMISYKYIETPIINQLNKRARTGYAAGIP